VNVYVVPGGRPVKVVDGPEPNSVTVAGLLVIVQEGEGKPLKTTLPVGTSHKGWVISPITGAEGAAFIVTDVVTCTDGQPPEAGIVYLTVYVRAVLVLGVIAPVPGSIVNPPGIEEKVPPV